MKVVELNLLIFLNVTVIGSSLSCVTVAGSAWHRCQLVMTAPVSGLLDLLKRTLLQSRSLMSRTPFYRLFVPLLSELFVPSVLGI